MSLWCGAMLWWYVEKLVGYLLPRSRARGVEQSTMSTRIENGCRIDFSAAPDVLRDGTTDSVDCPSILLKKNLYLKIKSWTCRILEMKTVVDSHLAVFWFLLERMSDDRLEMNLLWDGKTRAGPFLSVAGWILSLADWTAKVHRGAERSNVFCPLHQRYGEMHPERAQHRHCLLMFALFGQATIN